MICIDIMNHGDEILSVTADFIAVRKKTGEVDIVPIVSDPLGWYIDTENIVRIGYGDNTVVCETENGVQIVHF